MSAAVGRARRALTVGCAVVLLASCTSEGVADGDDRATTSVPRRSDPVAAGTVRLALGGPLVVDPLEASLASPTDLMVLDLLHDGLTKLDADGRAAPALAVRWTASEDQQTWRFELDPDATFTSDRAVTADDVVVSLTRMAAVGDRSLAALALEPVRGFRALVDGDVDTLAGVTARDSTTVEIVLDKPLSTLAELLAAPVLAVVDPDGIVDGTDLDLTGDWSVGNDDGVLMASRRAGTGAVDRVLLTVFDDAETAYDAFNSGAADWALVPPSRFGDAVEAHGDDDFAPFHAQLFLGMNLSSPGLGNGFLRLAILAAVDRDAIARAVYSDRADPLAGVVPAGVADHASAMCTVCAHDPGRAEELVEAAFPDGDIPIVRIDFDESPAQQSMAALVAADLGAVGIPTELRPLPLEDYKRFVVSGSHELFSFGWIGVYRSPAAYLTPLFASDSDDNLTGYRSEPVDGFLQRARSSADPTANAARWQSAERRILADGVLLPIAQFRTQAVVDERISGFAHAVDGTVDWSEVVAAEVG